MECPHQTDTLRQLMWMKVFLESNTPHTQWFSVPPQVGTAILALVGDHKLGYSSPRPRMDGCFDTWSHTENLSRARKLVVTLLRRGSPVQHNAPLHAVHTVISAV
jgi:hypothetical protein